jgi:hypothetical protein
MGLTARIAWSGGYVHEIAPLKAKARIGAPDVRGRFTLAAAGAEGRCVCEGCGACRGLPGYPCAAVVVHPEASSACRYCR